MHRQAHATVFILALFTAIIWPLRAQQTFVPSDLFTYQPITVTKDFNYQQIGPNTVTDYQPSLTIAVDYTGPTTADLHLEAVAGGATFTLQKTGESNAFGMADGSGPLHIVAVPRYSYRQTFGDNSTLAAAFANSTITIKITANGTTSSTPIYVTTSSPYPPFRLLTFDNLQSWDGGNVAVAWEPIAGLTPVTLPTLVIQRGNGPIVFAATASYTFAPTFAPGTSFGAPPIVTNLYNVQSSAVVGNISTVPGEIFQGTLTRQLPQSSGFTANIQTVTLHFPLKRPAPAPFITTQPASLTAVAGTTATLSPVMTGPGATYTWQKDGTTIPGATTATLTLASVQASDAGAYTVTATNSGGSVTSAAATLTVVAPTIAPTISATTPNLTVLAGAKSTLSVTPAGTAPFTYQWLRNGTPITGATSATLTLDTTLVSDAAAYSVTVTNSAGSVTSPSATLAVTPVSRISNISVLTSLSASTDTFTLGYVVGGNATTGPKPLLLRAAGPALAALGVASTLDDPKLELFAGSTKTTENDNWGTSVTSASALTAAFTAVGAFPFASPTSRDAATTANLTTRDNSVKIAASGTGLVLAEIYDATPTDTFTTATPRLLNVSVLKSLGTGLTVGFTIAGSTPKTVLIRAIGPTLGEPPFGVPGTVADPQLSLFSAASPTPLASNDNWSVPVGPAPAATALTAAFTATGAFGLPSSSKDAALLTTLPPGGYSVQVSGVANTTGVALVEVYEVP